MTLKTILPINNNGAGRAIMPTIHLNKIYTIPKIARAMMREIIAAIIFL